MFRLFEEKPQDYDEVEYLLDQCFAPGRTALSSYRLRHGVPIVGSLSLVARDEYDILAGSIRYWPIMIGKTRKVALLLGPVAVHPTRQGEGLGALLIDESISRARKAGHTRIVLVGDEPYYSRFGFTKASFLKFPPPTNPDRLLYRELEEGAFNGVSGRIRKFREPKPRLRK